ncbi:MAG: hypothetical protein ACRD4R_06675 [Candidatus Acidiferrales bacterium]
MEWIAIGWACVSTGLLAGYAAGVAQTRKYHERIFADLTSRFEERMTKHLIEKAEWLEALRKSARPKDES